MRRLFTFGCSFTNYIWPTWADLIGSQFDYHENHGKPGAGNFYISAKVHECNQINNFNEDDTVLVMLSSFNRFDYIKNEDFITCGNVYSQRGCLNENFIEEVWTEEYGYYSSWLYINSIINLLKSCKCKYKIMSAFDIKKREIGDELTEELKKLRILNCYEYIINNVCEVNLQQFSNNLIDNGEQKLYIFDEHGEMKEDLHPTISIHLEWVKNQLPEYYNESIELIKDYWENFIEILKHKTGENFRKILIKNAVDFKKNFVKLNNKEFLIYSAVDLVDGTFKSIIDDIIKYNPKDILFFSATEHELPCNINEESFRDLEKCLTNFRTIFHIIFGSHKSVKDIGKYPHRNFQYMYWPTFYLHYTKYGIESNYGNINDIKTTKKFDYLFQSLNNRPHRHRCVLIDELCKNNLLNDGIVSWNELSSMEGYEPFVFNYWSEQNIFIDEFKQKNDFYTKDLFNLHCLINLIAESNEDATFTTEKTFKSILSEQCFISVAAPNQNNVLKNYGFELYDEIFDYAFDGEEDLYKRCEGIVENIKKFKGRDYYEIHSIVKEKLKINKERAIQILENDEYIPVEFINFYKKYKEVFDQAILNGKIPDLLTKILKNK